MLLLDALYLKVRQNHRFASLALAVAIGANEAGERAMLGFDPGVCQTEAFWLESLPSPDGPRAGGDARKA